MYKVIIKNGEIIGTPRQDFISDSDLIAGLKDVSINDIQLVEDMPFYNSKTGKFQLFDKEEFEKQQIQEKREKLDRLSMTRGDVFEAIILAQGKKKAELRKLIEEDENLDDITRKLYLNRFDEAQNFYRGYPIFNLLAEKLGITDEQLDEFFETKDYRKLIPVVVEEEETEAGEEIYLFLNKELPPPEDENTESGEEEQTEETSESAKDDCLLGEDEIPF